MIYVAYCILQIEEIHQTLMRVHGLIDQMEKRESRFFDSVHEWLNVLEQILIKNRLAIGPNIAVLRGLLLSSDRGFIPSEIHVKENLQRRKIKELTAAHVVRKANEVVQDSLKPHIDQIFDAEKLVRYLVAILPLKVISEAKAGASSSTEFLSALWTELSELHSDMTSKVTGLVGRTNALVLLDQTLAKEVGQFINLKK